jgi:hypothetical protein
MIEREAGRQFDPAVVAAFKARKDGIVAILLEQRASNTPPPLGEGRVGAIPGNFPPPLGEGRVGADRILEKAS